jgi:MFS family permease
LCFGRRRLGFPEEGRGDLQIRSSPGWALFVLAAISTCGFIDRIVMNVLAQPIKTEFQLTDLQIGLVAGFAFALLNVLLGIWVARIAERRRRLTLIGIGTLLWSVATALCGTVTSFATLALARVGVGVGEAIGLPASQSVISDYFPREKRATAISVLLLAPPIGAFLGSAGGAMIAQTLGWRAAFVAASLPGFLLGVWALATVAEPLRGQHDGLGAEGQTVPPLGAVLARMWQRHSFRHLLAGSTIASLVGFGLNAFLAAFLLRRFGYSVTLSVIGSGWLADRMARSDARSYATIPAVSMLIAAPLYVMAVTRETAPAAIALLALAATVQYTYLGPSQGVFQNLMHPRMRASCYAVVGIVYSLVGGGLGPLVVGALSDHFAVRNGEAGGLTTAMAIIAVFYLWAAVHFFVARRRIREELVLPL